MPNISLLIDASYYEYHVSLSEKQVGVLLKGMFPTPLTPVIELIK